MSNSDLKLAHIIPVEDSEGDILLTLDAFEESKFDTIVSVARSGKEALDFLNKKSCVCKS
jgi:hypothetical protein